MTKERLDVLKRFASKLTIMEAEELIAEVERLQREVKAWNDLAKEHYEPGVQE